MLNTDDNKFLLDGNGIKTEFEFDFKIFKDTDLKVSKINKTTFAETPVVLNVDYTVQISRIQSGGKVIFITPPTDNEKAFGYRDIAILQPEEIPTEGSFPEVSLENALDRSCMISQQLQEQVNRTLKTPSFSNITNINIEQPIDGRAVTWEIEGVTATLKNSNVNPDDVVVEATEQVALAAAQVSLATEQATNAALNAEAAAAILGQVPTAQNVSSLVRIADGSLANFPLDDVKAHRRPYLAVTGKRQLTIYAGTFIKLVTDIDTRYLAQLTDEIIDVESILDTGATLTNGKDYYLYLVSNGTSGVKKILSLNATYPLGYTANNSRKIGGFHTLCVGVTAANAPRAGHPAIGYLAGDIIPNTIWALNFKAASGNEGKAYVAPRREWQYIYNVSGTGANTKSAYGATRSHTRNYHKFVEDLFSVNDMMITQDGFSCGMEGSNYLTAVAGAVQPNPDTTGGRLDTAGKRMISNYFLEEGCGLQVQFAEGLIGGGGSAWSAPDTDGKGQQYGTSYVVVLGGYWGDGGYAGPRFRDFADSASTASAGLGGRGRSCHIEY